MKDSKILPALTIQCNSHPPDDVTLVNEREVTSHATQFNDKGDTHLQGVTGGEEKVEGAVGKEEEKNVDTGSTPDSQNPQQEPANRSK